MISRDLPFHCGRARAGRRNGAASNSSYSVDPGDEAVSSSPGRACCCGCLGAGGNQEGRNEDDEELQSEETMCTRTRRCKDCKVARWR